MASKSIIDAEFEVVSGPLRVGDEHPVKKGWYMTDRYDRHGNILWYRPPGLISRWCRHIGFWGYLLLMAVGIGAAIIGGQ